MLEGSLRNRTEGKHDSDPSDPVEIYWALNTLRAFEIESDVTGSMGAARGGRQAESTSRR